MGDGRTFRQLLMSVVAGRREARRYNHEAREATAALARGDLKTAKEIFGRWSERGNRADVLANATHTLAWTNVVDGELAHAIDLMEANEIRFPKLFERTPLGIVCAADIALCYGLLGDLTKAGTWLTLSERRRAQERFVAGNIIGTKALARAVLDCRAGRAALAATILEDEWPKYEAALTGIVMRPLRIVRAFAHAAQGTRSAGMAEIGLVTVRPNYAGEFDWLGTSWPEMAIFLAAHDLGSD